MRSLFKLAIFAALIAGASRKETKFPASPSSSPWARATPAGAQTGAVYMTLDNKTNADDRLTGASSNVAAQVQVHEVAVVDGVMQMRQLGDGLPIPAGGSVTLKPGGYHVMLIGLKKPLAPGETFPLTLTFAKAGNISVAVPVQTMGAMQDSKGLEDKKSGASMGNGGGMSNMEMK